jgi:nitronate monooxygenase
MPIPAMIEEHLRLPVINTALKAWKDIWSAGQSVSGVHEIETVAALVEKMSREYQASRARINHSAFAG